MPIEISSPTAPVVLCISDLACGEMVFQIQGFEGCYDMCPFEMCRVPCPDPWSREKDIVIAILWYLQCYAMGGILVVLSFAPTLWIRGGFSRRRMSRKLRTSGANYVRGLVLSLACGSPTSGYTSRPNRTRGGAASTTSSRTSRRLLSSVM